MPKSQGDTIKAKKTPLKKLKPKDINRIYISTGIIGSGLFYCT